MPGVTVTTATRSGPTAPDRAPASSFFVAGLAERGPTDRAVLVRSLAEFEIHFGTRQTYSPLHDQVRTFFEEGGTRAYVVRVVGAAATIGTLTLQDRAGAPVPTLRLDAKGAGAWSASVTATVANGTAANTFKVTLAYGTETEVYDNLETPAQAVTRINKTSKWVTATDLGSATAAPGNQPAVLAATALSAGADDRASVVAANYVTALDTHAVAELGAGAVAVPGQASSAVGTGLLAHARLRNRLAILAVAQTATPADAITASQALRGQAGSEHAGLFYPWVKIPDGAGGTRSISPEGYVAGVRSRAHLAEGPWRAPGGLMGQSRFVVDLERAIDRTTGDQLDDSEVSALRKIADTVRLYGWRSLSADEENYALLTGRDVLNFLVVEGEKRLEQYVFRTIDARGHLFGEVHAEMVGLVEPMRVAGGLYEWLSEDGETIDPGYAVDTGPAINTPVTLAANELHASVAVRVSPTGALVKLLITKAALTAPL